MSSRTDPTGKKVALATMAAGAMLMAACSASGDQFLGTLMSDNAARTDASPPGDDAGGACPREISGALVEARSDLDLFFTIDRSQQSFNPDQWDTLVSGFTRFLHSDPAGGTGMGINYYPAHAADACVARCAPSDCSCLMSCGCDCGPRFDPQSCQRGLPCDSTSYQRPDVEIAPLPGNAGPMAASLFAQVPVGNRTIRPALKGSLDHIGSFEAAHLGTRVVDVLVAGGPPSSDCQQGSIADCADVAGSSNASTFVVAFDTAEPPFDPIAARGGTSQALRFDATRDIEPQLVALVDTIRAAPYCEYTLPQSGLDYRNVNVYLTAPADGGLSSSTLVSRVRDRSGCDAAGLGWYFDRTRIVACDETCKRIRAGMQPGFRVCASAP